MSDESVAGKWKCVRVRHMHDHPVLNINRRHDDSLTAGERIAEPFAEIMGGWSFIVIQSLLFGGWIGTQDRLMAEHDYEINMKAEQEVKSIMLHLEQQDEVMIDILRRLEAQHEVSLAHGATDARD